MKLDTLIRNTLNRVFPILHEIEEKPTVIVKHEVAQAESFLQAAETPYSGKTYESYEVECIFVEEPILVSENNQVILKKEEIFYIKKEDLPFTMTINDRLVMNNIEYKPKSIQEIFPLLKISVEKISV